MNNNSKKSIASPKSDFLHPSKLIAFFERYNPSLKDWYIKFLVKCIDQQSADTIQRYDFLLILSQFWSLGSWTTGWEENFL